MSAWRHEGRGWEPCRGIPIEDRAFRYGMSVFETVAVHRGKPVFLREHLSRLGSAALTVGWRNLLLPDSPPPMLPEFTGVLRIYLTAGAGAAGDQFCGSVYALFEECEAGTGFPALRVASSPAIYLPRPGGWKTGNYWQNVDALVFARSAGVDDALLFNPAGCLVGASMGNIFLEVDGIWKTPALETGARDGVVREWVKSQMPVEETLITADEVARCTACFVTNSRVGPRAVGELDGRALQTTAVDLQRIYQNQLL